jgi:hypothetical protein
MRSKVLATGFMLAWLAIFAITWPTLAADKSTAPRPTVSKMTITVGSLPAVYYSVQNGTPHLNAVYRLLGYAENEFTLVMQLQELKFDYVRNERVREALTMSGPGLYGSYASHPPGESTLKYGLSQGLAAEGTPDAAVKAIQLLEKAETDAAEELKLLSLQDQQQLQAATKKMRDIVAPGASNAGSRAGANTGR